MDDTVQSRYMMKGWHVYVYYVYVYIIYICIYLYIYISIYVRQLYSFLGFEWIWDITCSRIWICNQARKRPPCRLKQVNSACLLQRWGCRRYKQVRKKDLPHWLLSAVWMFGYSGKLRKGLINWLKSIQSFCWMMLNGMSTHINSTCCLHENFASTQWLLGNSRESKYRVKQYQHLLQSGCFFRVLLALGQTEWSISGRSSQNQLKYPE